MFIRFRGGDKGNGYCEKYNIKFGIFWGSYFFMIVVLLKYVCLLVLEKYYMVRY